MKIRNTPFLLSLTLNIFLLLVLTLGIYKFRDELLKNFTSTPSPNVVMFGDSLIASGNWVKELNRVDIKNSGFPGFTTSHLVWLLSGSVVNSKPKICFLEGGINDIGVGIPLSRTYKNYISMVDTLLFHKITPVLQSTLYVREPNDSVRNSKVDSLNIFLHNLALSKNLEYIDLNKHLASDKRLKAEFTTDGIHLKDTAYKVWSAEIEKVLQQKNL